MSKKTAVVLFNLGGPDGPDSVEPFLRNLFSDPAILGVPRLVRMILARLIARKRAPIAQGTYAHIGGKSPLLEETQKQARALEQKLHQAGWEAKIFICMRYWHPLTEAVVAEVKDYAPDEIILLPLYPQFSTTTTGSSFAAWEKEAKAQGLEAQVRKICCYPTEKHFIAAHAARIHEVYFQASAQGNVRVLFSAHGLPEKIVAKGDPYPIQVAQTVEKIVALLGIPELDYQLCYQSRVGPLKWIGPATEEEIRRAGEEGKVLVVVPVAFVSEHSETLVELDIEYRHLAEKSGVPGYFRVPALGVQEDFIQALFVLCTEEQTERNASPCRTTLSSSPCTLLP